MTDQDYPYKRYEKSGIWKTLDKGIADLVNNGDVAEQTDRRYIVGYLTKLLLDRRPSSSQWRRVQNKLRKTRDASSELEHALLELDATNRTPR
ncbi:MAG: hypothetical protein GC164_10445 [Phycisphaera sp.]|nr:hypothetical protein [Phycisphaera sp.]